MGTTYHHRLSQSTAPGGQTPRPSWRQGPCLLEQSRHDDAVIVDKASQALLGGLDHLERQAKGESKDARLFSCMWESELIEGMCGSALSAWREYAAECLRVRSVVGRCAAGLRMRLMAYAWRTWREWYHQIRRS